MAEINMGGNRHSAVYYGGDRIKHIYHGSALLWSIVPGNALPLITGSWTAYGLSVSVDADGIVTLDGAPNTTAIFVRLTASFAAATSSTGIADAENVMIPSGTHIRFGVEQVDGSFAQASNALNIVLRDTANTAQFNCKLGDGIWTQEGVTPADISCLCVYIRSGARCAALRIRPYITLL